MFLVIILHWAHSSSTRNSPWINCSWPHEASGRDICLSVCVSVKEVWLWLVLLVAPFKQHLGLDAVEASEPEDLSAAQFSLSAVNLLLIFCKLLPFLLPRLQAKSRLLQARQPLCWHCGDHLEPRLDALWFEQKAFESMGAVNFFSIRMDWIRQDCYYDRKL